MSPAYHTSSPTAKVVTAEPTASTTPAASNPRITGVSDGGSELRRLTSTGFTETACTRNSTSCGRSSGTCTSTSCRTSGSSIGRLLYDPTAAMVLTAAMVDAQPQYPARAPTTSAERIAGSRVEGATTWPGHVRPVAMTSTTSIPSR